MIEETKIDTSSNVGAALAFASTVTEPLVLTVPFEDADETIIVTTGSDGGAEITPVRDLFAAHASAPERRAGTIMVHDLASFIAHVNRDKRPDSVIFCDVHSRRLVAVLDFHGPADKAPRFGQDRIAYGFELSSQIRAWIEASTNRDGSAKSMDQKTFSRLIDDRLGDVGEGSLEPGSLAAEFARRRGIKFAAVSDLIAFTRTIAAKSTTESEEIVDENSGDVSIQYKKRGDVKTNDGTPIAVPQAFVLRIPILNGLGATEYNIACRLRYDIDQRGLAWRVELHALDKYVQAAIEEALVIVRRPEDTTQLAADVLAERDACAEVAASNDADATHDHIRARSLPSLPGGCGLPVYMATPPA